MPSSPRSWILLYGFFILVSTRSDSHNVEYFADIERAPHLIRKLSFLTWKSGRTSNATAPYSTTVTVIRDPMEASTAACLKVGPQTPALIVFASPAMVQALEDHGITTGVPLITSRLTDSQNFSAHADDVLYVEPSFFVALMDIVTKHYRWRKAVYFCETKHSYLTALDQYSKYNAENPGLAYDMSIYLASTETAAFTVLSATLLSSEIFDWAIILDVSPDISGNLVNLLYGDRKLRQRCFHFLFASLDSERVDFARFRQTKWKVTILSLLDTTDSTTLSASREWKKFTQQPLTSHDGLFLDAILLGQLLATYHETGAQRCASDRTHCVPWSQNLSAVCGITYSRTDSFLMASPLRPREISMTGYTGTLSFMDTGVRSNVTFFIAETHHNGSLLDVGRWNSTHGLSIKKAVRDATVDKSQPLKVVSVVVPAFLGVAPCSSPLTVRSQNDTCYDGYIAEFLLHLQSITNRTFLLHISSEYGKLVDGEWTGMTGEILRQEADLAVADFGILSARESVIDFTDAFMTDSISIMMKKPARSRVNLFSFLDPFNHITWLCNFAALMVTFLVVFLVGRLSPLEWEKVHVKGRHYLSNNFTVQEAGWSVVSASLNRGYIIPPRSAASKIAHVALFMWSLVVLASYTANLAAFLTIENSSPINSAEDLVRQSDMSYGISATSVSTNEFFRTSSLPVYRQMFEYMSTHNTYAKGWRDGVEKARNEAYAFIIQTTIVENLVNSAPCDLAQVGPPLFYETYGIGVPKGSPLREELSVAILQLKETGIMEIMRDKWIRHAASGCPEDTDKGKQRSMTLRELSGIFILLAAGLLLAVMVSLFEFTVFGRKIFLRRQLRRQLTATRLLSRRARLSMADTSAGQVLHPDQVNGSVAAHLRTCKKCGQRRSLPGDLETEIDFAEGNAA